MLTSSKNEAAVFLSTLLEGGGCTQRGFTYSTRSAELATNLQSMMKMFGISSRISKSIDKHLDRPSFTGAIRGATGKPSEIKVICSANSAHIFWKKIGFLYKHKIDRLNNMENFRDWFFSVKHTLQDKWPSISKYLQKMLVTYDLDVVQNITQVNKDKTYDLSVPGPVSYVANGFVVHNTECRTSKFTSETYFNSRYDKAFPRVPTFDSSNLEPVYLPAQLPMVLALQQQGIAMGTTTNIPAFTVESLYLVVQTAFSKYKEKNFVLPSNYLMKMLEWKSPYGGQVVSKDAEKLTVIKTGKGPIDWVCDYEESLSKRTLSITGFGPNWSYDNKKEKMSELPFVQSVADMSDDKGTRIVVTLKRCNDADAQDHLTKLKKFMSSRVTYRCNVVSRNYIKDDVIDTYESTFASMSIIQIISHWCNWRMKLEKEALRQEQNDLNTLLAKLDLMIKAVNNLEIIFKMLKQKNIDKVKLLASKLKISEEESKTIWGIAVGRLDSLSMDALTKERKSAMSRVKEIRILYKTPEVSILQQLKNQSKLYVS